MANRKRVKDFSPPWTTAQDCGGMRFDERRHSINVCTVDGGQTIAIVAPAPGKSAQSIAHFLSASPQLYQAARGIVDRHNARFASLESAALPIPALCLCEDCCDLLDALSMADGK